ncbi:MAG: pseudouridine synthase [Candidatus Fermentibacter sp.]|nr:pseudouridine synthase [Candidatus Fermentibacter sp.]
MAPTSSRTRAAGAGSGADSSEGMRLNRFLARAGVGSRRACDEIIRQGLVTVNGRRPESIGVQVAPGDRVEYSGRRIVLPVPAAYAWNKPVGVETSMADRSGRLKAVLARLNPGCVPVGRLDINTGGLLILTNDGDLTNRLTHPRWGIEREYILTLGDDMPSGVLQKLRGGIPIGPGPLCRPVAVTPLGARRLSIVLTTGRYHEVRRMASAAGLALAALERIRFGPVSIGDLPRGEHRNLSRREMQMLYSLVGMEPPSSS